MSKPKMILFCGWGWAATSPLIYTLQRNLKYAHFGYTKTFKILSSPKWKNNELTYKRSDSNNAVRIYEKHSQGIWENWEKGKPGTHHMNHTIDLEPLRDFPMSHLASLVTGDPSISKYMDFFHALHDHVILKGYKSVGDSHMGRRHENRAHHKQVRFTKGSQSKIESNKQYIETLKSEFDVKVLLIARDPIRRAFSNYCNWLTKNQKQPLPLPIHDYVYDLDSIRRFFKDNVYVTVMEELWEGDGVKGLSEFLEHPVHKSDLWENLYAPDRGHLIEHDSDVPCQAVGQGILELTPEIYWHYREKYDFVYEKWKRTFGSLPLYWGEPIEYS